MISRHSKQSFKERLDKVFHRVLVAVLSAQLVSVSFLPNALAAGSAKDSGLLIASIAETPVAGVADVSAATVTTSGVVPMAEANPLAAKNEEQDLIEAPSWSDQPGKDRAGDAAKKTSASKSESAAKTEAAKPDTSVKADDTTKSVVKTDETVKSETAVKTDATAKSETTVKTDATAKSETTLKTDETAKSETTLKTDETAKSETTLKTDETAKSETTLKTDETAKSETTLKTDETAKSETTLKTDETAKSETTLKTDETAKSETTLKTDETAKSDTTQAQTEPALQATVKTDAIGADVEKIASMPILGGMGSAEPLVIDNDEAVETQQTIKYEDLPTDEGKTKVKTGARFPVVISSQITSKSSKKGDPVEARLKYDLKIGDRLVAKKGSVVNGHINYSLKARSVMHSLVSPERWYRNSGCIGISFDEIINDKGEHLPLVATPARAARIVKNKAEGRELGINHDGQVTGPWSQQLRYKAIRIGLNAAMAPAGVFSFGAMPVVLGVIGAANPSFAFMKPVGQNVRHRRIKGFFWGALSGVPGSWLIEDTVVKGQEAVIKPGDEFLAEFQQEFTGEPATEAQLMAGANAKVHGQVMPEKKRKGK